jgi:hypothetical protein
VLARWLALELHSDGSGAFAVVVPDLNEPKRIAGPLPAERAIEDESVVIGVLSGLRLLARHARDRAAASGGALVRVQLFPTLAERPLQLAHRRGFMSTGGMLGDQIVTQPVQPAEQVIPLDSLADDGSDLVSAVYLLCSDLFQVFGFPEVPQVTRSGQLRWPYWSNDRRPQLEAWAGQVGVEVIDEAVSTS